MTITNPSSFTISFDDNIAHITIKGKVTIEIAKEIVAKRQALSGGSDYKILGNAINVLGIDTAARRYISHHNVTENITAYAVVIKNPLQKLLVNVVKTLQGPGTPIKVFKIENEALAWLRTQ